MVSALRDRGVELARRPAQRGKRGRSGPARPAPEDTSSAGRRASSRRMPTADFDPQALGLYPVSVDSWGGFVFLHPDPAPAQSLLEALGDLPQRFARYRLDELVVGHRSVVEVNANWKLVCENFCECLHCPPVHPELCRIVPA